METLKKVIISIIAINFVALGASLFLRSGLGGDSITLLLEGLHEYFELSYGLIGILYNGFFIILAIIVNRKSLGIGSFLYAITCGYFLDFYMIIIGSVISANSLIGSFIFILVGNASICLGFAILISMDSGMSGLDGVLYYIEEKYNISYKICKTVIDVIFCIVGMLLGGVFGIGSIFAMLTGGTIISYITRFIKKEKSTKYLQI
ncbi:MAG: hypothetical protein E6248_00125 [Clostridium sp.]|uniref:YczE/YyaS/YitT family protein n=1 Tax=Clostridium sp. TaxID=1506 RepID=UPI00290BB3CE|nr:hypothetical protein [Clostridium sp.]MDU5108822.1 hypothetical protein [Clostridium sp.]